MKIGWKLTITLFPGSLNIKFEFVGFAPAAKWRGEVSLI